MPSADPAAIRACLIGAVAAEFEAEWNVVMDEAKAAMDLAPVRAMLSKWVQFAVAEQRDPGSYLRTLATATRTQGTGEVPAGSVSGDQVKKLLAARLATGR